MLEKQRGGASAGMPVLGCWRWLTLSALMMVACRPAEAPQAAPPSDTIYTIAIVASTPSDLPKCTASLSGTTAYVQSPVGLYSCISNTWVPLPCTTLLSGAVAYASSSQTLLACVSGQWTKVALPQGAQGAAGPAGAQGAKGERGDAGASSLVVQLPVAAGGATCPYGGTEIESGLDDNGNHVLDSAEVTSISWVCDGATGATGAAAAPIHVTAEPPGANCAAGGERIDVGTQTAYVCNGTSAVSTGAGGSTPDPGTGGAAPPKAGSLPPHCAAFPSGVAAAVVTLSGIVVAPTATGASPAVAGATVQALGPDGSSLGTTTTDTNGRFSLSLGTGGAPLAAVLRVSKTGFIVAYWNPPAPIVGDTEAGVSLFSPEFIAVASLGQVDLQKAQILVGVVDCQGQPVQRAQMNAVPAPDGVLYFDGGQSTGSLGLALLRNATPGNVQLSAVVGGFAFAGPNVSAIAGAVVETMIVAAGSLPPICAIVPSGPPPAVINVSGNVIETSTTGGVPAADAMVEALGPDGSSLGTATTDAGGQFSLSLVTGGAPVDVVLRIFKAGFEVTYWQPPAPLAGSIGVGVGLFRSEDVQALARSGQVDPQKAQILVGVADCQAQPVANARLRAAPAPDDIVYYNGGSSTDRSGVLVLLLNATPGKVQLSAVVGGLAFTGPNVTAVAGAVVETTIVVQPPPPAPPAAGSLPPNCTAAPSGPPPAVVTLSGSIFAETTTDTTPAADAMVEAIKPDGSSLGTATTDADGRFSLPLVTGGVPLDAALRISKTGFAVTYWKAPVPLAADITVGASIFEDFQALFPSLPVDPQKAQAFVLVRDCQGQPVAGAEVGAAPAPEAILYADGDASTESTGFAVLVFNLTPGDVQLSAVVGGVAFAGPNVSAVAGAVIQTEIIVQPAP